MKRFPIGVQPYTIREALAKDYVGALERVAEIGYKGVEIGPPPEGMSVDSQKQLLDRLGLSVVGCHAGFDTLEFDVDRLADYLEQVDGGRCVAISLRFASKEEVLAKAKRMNEIGERFRKRGVAFLYHNHDWEFEKFDGAYALDLLLEHTDPELVKTELDTYWIAKGGEDPVAYLKQLEGRAPRLHLKDMEAGEERFFAEVGEGVLDFRSIAQVAEDIGVEWMVVEQDACRRDPFESLRISYENLKGMGFMA
ncbi:sugar phosphate isomerase/epimerase [Paenibacillus antri]|uniref:Sugar phosphate isomerase/epimerase n=1 Tax=Paenibacillus antri TaxID=2582848 RepID=A0A5R9GL52_9BACL|nr:sugar phosphate isomerase/epimerase [Paenibacillus antri]TLS53803.1 sugar phosphate isomerase/epimerase [Paenibacillus antri]